MSNQSLPVLMGMPSGHSLVRWLSRLPPFLSFRPYSITSVKDSKSGMNVFFMHVNYILGDSDVQDEDPSETCVVKEHRRYAHSAAEQKRRDAIRVWRLNNCQICFCFQG